MLVLREKVRCGVFPRCKSRSIDYAPEFSGTINQGILHCRHFLVEPNLVFIKALTAHNAITSDLLEHRTRSIDEDCRFGNLLSSRVLLGIVRKESWICPGI